MLKFSLGLTNKSDRASPFGLEGSTAGMRLSAGNLAAEVMVGAGYGFRKIRNDDGLHTAPYSVDELTKPQAQMPGHLFIEASV